MSRLMTGLAVAVAGLALLRGPGAAEESGDLPPDLERASSKAGALLSIRVADLWNSRPAKVIREKLGDDVELPFTGMTKDTGLAPKSIERLTVAHANIGPGPSTEVMFVAAVKAPDRKAIVNQVVFGGEEKKHAGKTYIANARRAVLFLDDRHYAVGTEKEIQKLIDAGKSGEGPLTPALRLAAGKHVVVVAVNPEQLEKLSDELPADAEPFKPLLKAKLGTLTLDLGDAVKASLRISFSGADEAKAGTKAVETGRKMALGFLAEGSKLLAKDDSWKAVLPFVKEIEKELKTTKVQQVGPAVTANMQLKLDDRTVTVVLAEAVAKTRQAAMRTQSANNLKQIGLAMHNYHEVNRSLPPQAIHDKAGKALLSWRVLILPYLDQDALYKEFKLDEPWDSAHNKKLIAKMPPTYKLPGAKVKHVHGTFYQVLHGKDAAFEGKTGLRLFDFTDGTSNTILAVEADKDVPWTKPDDVPFDAGKDAPKLGNHWKNGVQVLFGDGSVRFLSESINQATLKAMITRNGGEVINQ